MLDQLLGHLARQVVAGVVHGTEQPVDAKSGIQDFSNLLDGIEQRRQPFQGVVLALHGNHDAVGGDQRIHRKHGERRRAVDDDVVVLLSYRLQRVPQTQLPGELVQQRNLRAGEIRVGRRKGVVAVLHRHHHVLQLGLAHEDVVARQGERILVDAAPHRGIALRVEIHQQYSALGGRK